LPTGQIGYILDVTELVRDARGRASPPFVPEASPSARTLAVKKRVLLADDSLTTRTLERSILEVAGYEVLAAADGNEAWRLLQEQGADIIVSDIEMPRMDGFALAEAVRGSRRFKDLPIILVTARDSEQDKRRGLEAGASAYLVKSAFEQKKLLDAVAQFL
jgi:two-component system chemotaxis sensor kinase CheA